MVHKIKRRSFIKTNSAALIGVGMWPGGLAEVLKNRTGGMVLADRGKSLVPIVLQPEAVEPSRLAAEELARYIGKISGGTPEIIGDSRRIPESAIWIGIHPLLSKVYPGLDTGFRHPEEILIASNGRHLVIAGRDKFFGDHQVEYGTVNAVYTFLQESLDVRWLWPGESGEDIIWKETLTVPSFEYRFHPELLKRSSLLLRSERLEETDTWTLRQRIKLDSLKGRAGGHAYTDYWERFHEEHPDWFALQPDGTRSGYPNPRTVKMCLSNPGVAEQWLADAEEAIRKDPELNMIMAGENDGHSSGLCVCENCRAWDHPDGHPWTYRWDGGVREEYVAMSDRYVTYFNRLARMLRKKFPDRDNLYVQGLAYGPSTPPPVKAVPDDNVIISYVGKWPTIDETTRREQKEQFRRWARVAPHVFYRPNLWYWTGGAWALPDAALTNVGEDFRFLGENNCIGIFADYAQHHWSTQAPQYYLMTQLTWDPSRDGKAILEDYYRRGFGRAAGAIKGYWDLMEEGFVKVTGSEGFGPHGSYRFRLVEILGEVYDDAFLGRAGALIEEAEKQVTGEPEKYGERVGFIRTGFELTGLMIENIALMKRIRESKGRDRKAVKTASDNWKAIEKLYKKAGPVAFNYGNLLGKMQGRGYQGNMEDYFGPPSDKFLHPGRAVEEEKKRDEPHDID